MLSPADMVIIGAAALIVFGPDQLPKVARKAGLMMREVQNTSQSFIREMERAADAPEAPWPHPVDAYDPTSVSPRPPFPDAPPTANEPPPEGDGVEAPPVRSSHELRQDN